MSLLKDLLTKYDTDNRIWGHAPAYEKHLDQERVTRMLEIGIDAPHHVVASLRAWRDYFPNADIYGINNDARFIYKDDRIETALCDAYDAQQLAETIKSWRTPLFDFIRDNAVPILCRSFICAACYGPFWRRAASMPSRRHALISALKTHWSR